LPDGVALITGGGRGIGASTARVLASDGWDVIVAARTRGQIDAVAEEIGGRAIELDVSDAGSVERAFAEAGHVDFLFANAGVADAPFWRVFEVNVLGVQQCCDDRRGITDAIQRDPDGCDGGIIGRFAQEANDSIVKGIERMVHEQVMLTHSVEHRPLGGHG